MDYYLDIQLALLEPRIELLDRSFIATSAPELTINEWLAERNLPRLSSWYYDGQSGSNAPRSKGVLHIGYLKTKGRPEKLVITSYKLVPVDPFSIF